MIWAIVSSWSCFCWLYRASPSLAAKNIINLISALIVWWCPHVESSLVLLEEGVCYDQCIFLGPNMAALRWLGSQERWPVLGTGMESYFLVWAKMNSYCSWHSFGKSGMYNSLIFLVKKKREEHRRKGNVCSGVGVCEMVEREELGLRSDSEK